MKDIRIQNALTGLINLVRKTSVISALEVQMRNSAPLRLSPEAFRITLEYERGANRRHEQSVREAEQADARREAFAKEEAAREVEHAATRARLSKERNLEKDFQDWCDRIAAGKKAYAERKEYELKLAYSNAALRDCGWNGPEVPEGYRAKKPDEVVRLGDKFATNRKNDTWRPARRVGHAATRSVRFTQGFQRLYITPALTFASEVIHGPTTEGTGVSLHPESVTHMATQKFDYREDESGYRGPWTVSPPLPYRVSNIPAQVGPGKFALLPEGFRLLGTKESLRRFDRVWNPATGVWALLAATVNSNQLPGCYYCRKN